MPPKKTKRKTNKKKKTKKPVKRINNANNTQRVTVNVNSNNEGAGQTTDQLYDAIKSSYGSLQPSQQPIDLTTPLIQMATFLKSNLGNAQPLDSQPPKRPPVIPTDPFQDYVDLGDSVSVMDYSPLSESNFNKLKKERANESSITSISKGSADSYLSGDKFIMDYLNNTNALLDDALSPKKYSESFVSDSKTTPSNFSTMNRNMNYGQQAEEPEPMVEESDDEMIVVPGKKKNLKQMKARGQLFEHPKGSNQWYEKDEVEKLFYNDDRERLKKNRLRNYLNYGEPDPAGKKDGLENDLYVKQKEAWHNAGNPIPTKLDEIWPHKLQLIKNRANAKGPHFDDSQRLPKEYKFD